MIKELELEIIENEVPALRNFPEFEKPVSHFATDPSVDPERMLPNAVITDHRKGTVTLWWLLTENNLEIAKEARNGDGFFFRHSKNGQEAHCMIPCPDGTYLAFFEKSSIGIRFAPKNNKAFLFDTLEAFGNGSRAESFGITAYANPDEDANYFYASFMRSAEDGTREVVNVRLAYDFSHWEEIRHVGGNAELRLNAPHMTRLHDGRMYDSHFKDVAYRVPAFPNRELSRHELVDSGMRKIFDSYKKVSGLPEGAEFRDFAETEDGSVRYLDARFGQFVEKFSASLGRAHVNDLVCEKIFPGCELLPGKITHFPVDNPGEAVQTETSKGSPAHFEFSKDGKRVFVSSHNFDILCDAVRYFGPAAIDAFDLRNGEMRKTGTFESPEGFRFTSHRVFENEGGEFVATIGQPNRLYVVRTDSMTEAFHVDLAENPVDSVPKKNLGAWIRSTHSDEKFVYFRPFEISENGTTAYVPFRKGAKYAPLTKNGGGVREIHFSVGDAEFVSKFERLKALNAHCYAISA